MDRGIDRLVGRCTPYCLPPEISSGMCAVGMAGKNNNVQVLSPFMVFTLCFTDETCPHRLQALPAQQMVTDKWSVWRRAIDRTRYGPTRSTGADPAAGGSFVLALCRASRWQIVALRVYVTARWILPLRSPSSSLLLKQATGICDAVGISSFLVFML